MSSTDRRTDKVNPVYPPPPTSNLVGRGYNNLCAYQISFLETRAGPKMGRQILGDFGGTKMAITSLKIKISKKFKKFWLSWKSWLLKTSIFGVWALHVVDMVNVWLYSWFISLYAFCHVMKWIMKLPHSYHATHICCCTVTLLFYEKVFVHLH